MTTKTWNKSSNGDWSETAPWGGSLPQPGDDVVVAGSGTLTHSTGDDTVHNMTLDETLVVTGGSITTTGALSVQNATLSNSASFMIQGGGNVVLGTSGTDSLFLHVTPL